MATPENVPRTPGDINAPSPGTPVQNPEELIRSFGEGVQLAGEQQQQVRDLGFEPQLIGGKTASTQFGESVLSSANKPGELETRAFEIRSGLPAEGEARKAFSFFDEQSGTQVHAPAGFHFELFPGGGVRKVRGLVPVGGEGAPASSLFTQPTQAGPTGEPGVPVEGFKKEDLAITPIEGKTIERTGQTIKNPQTGVDEQAAEGEILIQYTDGTVERRQISALGTPGTATAIGEFGRTPEELGITRRTAIKGGEGDEVTRMPQTAREALDAAQTPEEKDRVLTGEGLKSTSELELIGKSFRDRTASAGNVFFQDPVTREILERPEALQDLALPSTSPTVAAERSDIPTMFRAVFGREASQDELSYWRGRRDKSGSALIGAMQFAKQQGAAVGAQPGEGAADPIESTNVRANADQQRLASVFKEQGVTPKSSEKKALRAELEALKTPDTRSALEFTQEQLAASQFQEATNDLNKSKAALRELDTNFISTLEESERTPGLSLGAIRRNQSELEVAYNRARRDLVTEVQANSDIVQAQSAIMGMMIDAFKFDSQQAQVEYQNKFNKAMSMYDLVTQEERDQFNIQQKLQDNQRANLSVITGMLAEGTINYDNLSADAKSQIATMEQSVGLQGISRAIGKTPMPPVVSIGSPVTAADGSVHTPIYSQDPSTGEVTISNYTSPFKAKVTGGGAGGVDLFSGLGNLFGVLGEESDFEIVEDGALDPPPMTGIPNSKLEWPPGSGDIWEADNIGNWL